MLFLKELLLSLELHMKLSLHFGLGGKKKVAENRDIVFLCLLPAA